MKKRQKLLITNGKRKRAIARAVFKKGDGIIKINKILLDNIKPYLLQLKLKEPLLLKPNIISKYDVIITIKGGGITGQTDAARQALCRGIVQLNKTDKIKQIFNNYNKNFLVTDSRRNETSKPSASRRGARRKIQLSKR
ncbi:MAG: 30S ribosomal protein S9 [Candidatus Aenigmarchaeota archaeon ex4484_52]|nr:MAG: 30S ribosomal protein S9 [Candidatus Aenigmarchaeota archaeon ex4484_52]